jgi:hypothetical protein
MLITIMSFIRAIRRKMKDGSERQYYYRVESYRKDGRVHQRMIEYLGTNPNRLSMNIDVATAAKVASILSSTPSPTQAARMLREAGIPVVTRPGSISLIYNPPLRMHTLRIE